jgi:hypothetical protein
MAKIGDHAVVLGASMAGLLAARTLSDFSRRSRWWSAMCCPMTPRTAGGAARTTPARAARTGLAGAGGAVPRLLDELVTDGVPYFDGRDLSKVYYSLGGHQAVRTGSAESFTAYTSSRPFLECFVRRRALAIADVTLLDDHDVVELTFTPDHKQITEHQTDDPTGMVKISMI